MKIARLVAAIEELLIRHRGSAPDLLAVEIVNRVLVIAQGRLPRAGRLEAILDQRERAELVRQDHAAGVPLAEIMERHKLSRRHALRLIERGEGG